MNWSLLNFKGLTELFNVHPAFTHFPVALFPTALFFYLAGILWKNDYFFFGGRICLILAFLSTILTAWTGFRAMHSFPHTEEIRTMIETHKDLGLLLFLTSLLLVIWTGVHHKKKATEWNLWFLILLFFVNYLALQNGDLGSRMVYENGAAVKTSMPVTEEKIGEERRAREGLIPPEK